MNTGEKNTLGRTIYKGKRGGTYVLAGTRKVYSYKKAAPATPVPLGPPKNTLGRVIYKGARGGLYVYAGRINAATGRIVENKTKKIRTFKASNANRARATMPLPPPPAPPVPLVNVSVNRMRRLSNIKRKLNAIKEKRRTEAPKTRYNIESRLRLALRRARARIGGANVTRGSVKTQITIPFYHEGAHVPRKKGVNRMVNLQVYKDVPLMESGGVVGMLERDFDLDWFKRQDDYIKNLNDYDFWTVQAHTNRSHYWIGAYTRTKQIAPLFRLYNYGGANSHITPLWPQVRQLILNGFYSPRLQWVRDFKNSHSESERYKLYTKNLKHVPASVNKQALDMYVQDLKRIIARAPKSRKKMILYRGSDFDIFHYTMGHWHTLNSFCSAAYNINWSKRYSSLRIQRITVLPGTPVLLVAGTNQWAHEGEYEVMVNIDTKYLIRGRNVRRQVYEVGRPVESRVVTDVIIAK